MAKRVTKSPTVRYVIVRRCHEYDDERFYYGEEEGGQPEFIYDNKDRAEEEVRKRNRDFVLINVINHRDYGIWDFWRRWEDDEADKFSQKLFKKNSSELTREDWKGITPEVYDKHRKLFDRIDTINPYIVVEVPHHK